MCVNACSEMDGYSEVYIPPLQKRPTPILEVLDFVFRTLAVLQLSLYFYLNLDTAYSNNTTVIAAQLLDE